mgnify:CR=1 FL=1
MLGSKRPIQEPSSGWQITYSSFILIVLTFFIMVCSFVSFEEAKVSRFVRSFSQVMSIFPSGVKVESGKEVVLPSPDMVKREDPLSVAMLDIEKLKEKSKMASQIEVFKEKRGLVLRLQSSVAFALGSAELTKEMKAFIKGICPILEALPNAIRVEGHTDNLPIHTEEFPSNWELSAMRAVNVLRFLVGECGIDPARVSAAGYSEYRPIAPNSDEEGRQKNRRVELVLLPMEVANDGEKGSER